MKKARRGGERRTTILLKDLDPWKDVRGGAGKSLFGEQAETLEPPAESGGTATAGPLVKGPSKAKTSR
jgi:hypothetical protein